MESVGIQDRMSIVNNQIKESTVLDGTREYFMTRHLCVNRKNQGERCL